MWIKNKTYSLILIFWFILFLNIYFFDWGLFFDKVFAADWDEDESNFVAILEVIVQFFYIITRPFITIAWASLSNEFVYWSIFNLDDSLWMFWNMMKNFANYIIAFVFLASIFFYLLNYKQDKFNPKKLLPKMLVAAVWVQASWFIVAVLIDISTILTYSLWAMPLNVLENVEQEPEPIMLPIMSVDLSELEFEWLTDSERTVMFKNPWDDTRYVSCKTDWAEIDWEWLDSDELRESLWEDADYSTDWCVFWGKLFWQWWDNWHEDREDLISSWRDLCDPTWDDCMSVKEYSDSLKWFAWPLYTLFWSLTNISDMSVFWVWGQWANVWAYSVLAIMKIIIFLALVIPLITLAIILIIRWVLIWLIVVVSPLLAISWSLGLKMWLSEDKMSIWSILWLIFLPVTAAFAVSISIIFLTVLTWTLDEWVKWWEAWVEITSTQEENDSDDEDDKTQTICFDLPLWDDESTQTCFTTPWEALWISPFLDIFWWILINLFAVALMWAIIFAALKTSKMTSWVVKWVDNISKEAMKTAPIIPWGQRGQSIGSIERSLWHLETQPSRMQWKQFSEWWLLDDIENLQWTMSWKHRETRRDLSKNLEGLSDEDSNKFTSKVTSSIPSWTDYTSVEWTAISSLKQRDSTFDNANSFADIASDPEMRAYYNANYWNIDEILVASSRSDDSESLRMNLLETQNELYESLQSDSWADTYYIWSWKFIKKWDIVYNFNNDWRLYTLWEPWEINLSNASSDEIKSFAETIKDSAIENAEHNINRIIWLDSDNEITINWKKYRFSGFWEDEELTLEELDE